MGLDCRWLAALYEDPGFKVLNLFVFNFNERLLNAKCEFLDFVLLW